MKKIENNPHYQNGLFWGIDMIEHIDKTEYQTVENALESKEQLVKDLKKEFGWDESHKDVAEVMGVIAACKQKIIEDLIANPKLGISIEDVLNIAQEIGIDFTEEEAEKALRKYPEYQINDSGATWNLVMEAVIHSVKGEI
jgi:hypothetical protein